MKDDSVKVLGVQTNEFKGLHVIPIKGIVEIIQFDSDELIALCPETAQRDFYSVMISLYPNKGERAKTIESKSLKLYLATFADKGIFAEELASEIADEVFEALSYKTSIAITLVQKRRGGIEISIKAQRERAQNGQETE